MDDDFDRKVEIWADTEGHSVTSQLSVDAFGISLLPIPPPLAATLCCYLSPPSPSSLYPFLRGEGGAFC